MISTSLHTPMSLSVEQVRAILEKCASDFPHSLGRSATAREAAAEKLYHNAYWILSYEEDGTLAGFISYYINEENHFSYIPYIWVSIESRGSMCGSGMMSEIKTQIREKSHRLLLEVRKDNLRAISFYQRNGFTIAEDREDSYLLECVTL